MFKKYLNLNKFSSLLFYLSILIFIIGFNFQHNPPSGWYQQFLPNLSGAQISDITFLDSLLGYAVTKSPAYILKTTDGGDKWNIKFNNSNSFVRIEFINASTGFTNAFTTIFKTTNAGENWNAISLPDIFGDDMYVLNEDTIWLAMSEGFTGGVFRTTNGGINWTRQLSPVNNPNHIYMFNARIGFTSTNVGTFKTTNSGVNWFSIPVTSFLDIYFSDSLTGWKNNGVATFFQKTTDGGMNWITYNLPTKQGFIDISRIIRFDNVNKDTIWGAGSVAFLGPGRFRGLLYKSTNSGETWGYQLPDTSIHSGQYQHVQFSDRLTGWAYWGSGGIHTTTGGDTTIYTSVNQVNTKIPAVYKLFQNYPNPFNPKTVIGYQLTVNTFVTMRVYDALGSEVKTLVSKKQNAGEYKVNFDGSGLTSGIYFYSLFMDGVIAETKKMVLVR